MNCERCGSPVLMNLPGIDPHTDYDKTRCVEACYKEGVLTIQQLNAYRKRELSFEQAIGIAKDQRS